MSPLQLLQSPKGTVKISERIFFSFLCRILGIAFARQPVPNTGNETIKHHRYVLLVEIHLHAGRRRSKILAEGK